MLPDVTLDGIVGQDPLDLHPAWPPTESSVHRRIQQQIELNGAFGLTGVSPRRPAEREAGRGAQAEQRVLEPDAFQGRKPNCIASISETESR